MRKTACVLACAAASMRLGAMTVTIDRASPAAERDFAYHMERMGAAASVSLKVAPHEWGVKSDADEAFRLRIAGGDAGFER